MHHPTDRITHTTAFVTPVVDHWLEREIAQWVDPMKDRSDDPPHHEQTLYLWATSRSVRWFCILILPLFYRYTCTFSLSLHQSWSTGWNEKYLNGKRERNVLFHDALNTFYILLYGVRHKLNNHSDRERGNPLPSHRLLFSISSKGSFICIIPQTWWHIPRPLLHQSWGTGWNEKLCRNKT